MWQDLLERIWGDTEGWAITAVIKGDKYRQRSYRYPDQLDVLTSDLRGYNSWGSVYFYPIITEDGERKKDHVDEVPLLWIDKDKGDPSELKPRPTICWETSEGKCQAVWLLAESISPERAEKVNRYLAYRLGGDRGCWDIAHILRVPGSKNYKYDPPQDGVLLWDDGPEYTIEELEPTEHDIDLIKERMTDEKDIPDLPNDLPEYHEVITKWGSVIPQAAWKLLNQKPTEDDDWSKQLWKMERLLLQAKIPIESVFVIVRESNWNKYARDNRPDLDLWKDVWKAHAEDEVVEKEKEKEGKLQWMGLRDLLVFTEEPTWLVEGAWMESNVGWIAGVGKSFKSVISLDLGLSVASGDDFLGQFKVNNPGPVMMIQEEDPPQRMANRVQAMCGAKGIGDVHVEELEDGIYVEMPSDSQIPFLASIGSGFSFLDGDVLQELENALYQFKPRMIILDPWFMMTAGIDEFKSSEITEVLKLLKEWRNEYGCAVAVVHHYRKGKGDSYERLYGSQALYAWSENSLFVSRDKKSNLVTVQRDIKDADHTQNKDFNVTFHDISDDYIFNVVESETPESFDKVLSYLRTKPVGTQILKDDIVESAGVNEKTVRQRLHELAEKDKLIIESVGRGGKMAVITLSALYEIEGIEMDL